MWCNRDFRLTVLAGGEAGFEHLQCPDQVGVVSSQAVRRPRYYILTYSMPSCRYHKHFDYCIINTINYTVLGTNTTRPKAR